MKRENAEFLNNIFENQVLSIEQIFTNVRNNLKYWYCDNNVFTDITSPPQNIFVLDPNTPGKTEPIGDSEPTPTQYHISVNINNVAHQQSSIHSASTSSIKY